MLCPPLCLQIMCMHMSAGLHRLDDAADFAAILRHAVANAEVLQRQLVAQWNSLFRPRLQAGVVDKVSSDAVRAWLQVNYGHTDVVGGIVHEKMNHLLSFRRNNISHAACLPGVTCFVSK